MVLSRKGGEKMKKNKLEKIMITLVLLVIGFFSGVTYSLYNLQVVKVQHGEQGELITIKILEQKNNYYYEK